jgi:hypothetical protein
MRFFLILNILLFLSIQSKFHSQSIKEFPYFDEKYGGEAYLGINPAFNILSNPKAPFPENHRVNAFLIDFQLNIIRTRKFGSHFNYSNKGVGDLVYLLGQIINGKGSVFAREGTTFSNIIGWCDQTFNLNEPSGFFQGALGYNFGDYVYAGYYLVDSNINKLAYVEPQGYYLAAGPTAEARFVLGPFLMLETNFSYALPFIKLFGLQAGSEKTDYSYPYPHFAHARIELLSKWGVFTKMDYNWLINRGSNPAAGRRFGITLGFKFKV